MEFRSLRATDEFTSINGTPSRIWVGKDEHGADVMACIAVFKVAHADAGPYEKDPNIKKANVPAAIGGLAHRFYV